MMKMYWSVEVAFSFPNKNVSTGKHCAAFINLRMHNFFFCLYEEFLIVLKAMELISFRNVMSYIYGN